MSRNAPAGDLDAFRSDQDAVAGPRDRLTRYER